MGDQGRGASTHEGLPCNRDGTVKAVGLRWDAEVQVKHVEFAIAKDGLGQHEGGGTRRRRTAQSTATMQGYAYRSLEFVGLSAVYAPHAGSFQFLPAHHQPPHHPTSLAYVADLGVAHKCRLRFRWGVEAT